MNEPLRLMRIGEAAEAAGVSTRTLRYYEQRGLLTPSGHSPGGERRYTEDDVARLVHIRELAELLGADLDTIGAMLSVEDRLASIRTEYRKPGQSAARQLELLAEAEALNTDLQQRVDARIAGMKKVQAHLRAKAARYADIRDTLRSPADA
ncbi:MAG TPA: MerR family transcriptional regulator [Mycobacteriales bacterium]|nr:MerR family transcriptional regulator [Mycobacteriales bacterium]